MTDTRHCIAILDDQEAVRVALHRLFRAAGMCPRSFATAQELFQSLDDSRPDCLILDAQMPQITGVETIAWLRERSLDIPTIVITGRIDAGAEVQHLAQGAFAVLRKPPDAEVLIDTVNRAIAASNRE